MKSPTMKLLAFFVVAFGILFAPVYMMDKAVNARADLGYAGADYNKLNYLRYSVVKVQQAVARNPGLVSISQKCKERMQEYNRATAGVPARLIRAVRLPLQYNFDNCYQEK